MGYTARYLNLIAAYHFAHKLEEFVLPDYTLIHKHIDLKAHS